MQDYWFLFDLFLAGPLSSDSEAEVDVEIHRCGASPQVVLMVAETWIVPLVFNALGLREQAAFRSLSCSSVVDG